MQGNEWKKGYKLFGLPLDLDYKADGVQHWKNFHSYNTYQLFEEISPTEALVIVFQGGVACHPALLRGWDMTKLYKDPRAPFHILHPLKESGTYHHTKAGRPFHVRVLERNDSWKVKP